MTTLRLFGLAVLGVVAVGTSFLSRGFDPSSYEGGRSRDVADRMERNSSAAATMLGELRATAADLLFLKTERYLDSGIAYQPHVENELGTLQGETNAMDAHQAEVAEGPGHEHHEGTPTIIPTAEQDFRGFIGHLEREVKPWRDPLLPHHHTTGTELLPWYRVMTLADPTDVRAYAIASWWLQSENIDEGIRFLEEGMRNNPKAFQLPLMMGRLLAQKATYIEQHGATAAEAAQMRHDAAANQVRAGELGFAARPKDWTEKSTTPEWTSYTEEDFLAALRLAVLLEYRYGDKAVAVQRARDYLARLGSDGVLERFLRENDTTGA